MKHCCLINQIGDVKTINKKITYTIILEELEPYTLACNLFMFAYDVIVCFRKFIFQLAACIRVKTKLLCIILKIENTAYIITLSHMRIDFYAVFIINLIQLFRNHKAEDKGNQNKYNTSRVCYKIEDSGCKENRNSLHSHIQKLKEAVYCGFRLRNAEYKVVVIGRVVIAVKVNFRSLIEHLFLKGPVKARLILKLPAVDKKAVRNNLQNVKRKNQANVKKCLSKRLVEFCTAQYITDSQYMLQKDYSLIAEGVVEVINHIKGAGLKTELPEVNLIFKNCAFWLLFFCLCSFCFFVFHFLTHAQIPSFCFDLSAR